MVTRDTWVIVGAIVRVADEMRKGGFDDWRMAVHKAINSILPYG